MDELWLAIPVNPEPWAMGTAFAMRHEGQLSARVGQNKQLDSFKKAVKECIEGQPMLEGKYTIHAWFWRNRATYTTQAQRTHRKHEADLTNMQKALEDALQGIVIGNDRDVQEFHSYMVDQGPDVIGRIVLYIHGGETGHVLPPSNVMALADSIAQPIAPSTNDWRGPNYAT